MFNYKTGSGSSYTLEHKDVIGLMERNKQLLTDLNCIKFEKVYFDLRNTIKNPDTLDSEKYKGYHYIDEYEKNTLEECFRVVRENHENCDIKQLYIDLEKIKKV